MYLIENFICCMLLLVSEGYISGMKCESIYIYYMWCSSDNSHNL